MTRSQRGLAAFFTFAGAMHFIQPRSYEAMMPDYLPHHRKAVVLSGLAEIAGGVAVIPRQTRPLARWWLLGLLAAVYPANIDMAIRPDAHPKLKLDRIPRWALWARLPLQFLAAWWVWRATAD